jgi:hypothetical protein
MIKIYIVCHKTFENTNVFFTNKSRALVYIEDVALKRYPEETRDCWYIIEILEGEEFNGDLFS